MVAAYCHFAPKMLVVYAETLPLYLNVPFPAKNVIFFGIFGHFEQTGGVANVYFSAMLEQFEGKNCHAPLPHWPPNKGSSLKHHGEVGVGLALRWLG